MRRLLGPKFAHRPKRNWLGWMAHVVRVKGSQGSKSSAAIVPRQGFIGRIYRGHMGARTGMTPSRGSSIGAESHLGGNGSSAKTGFETLSAYQRIALRLTIHHQIGQS